MVCFANIQIRVSCALAANSTILKKIVWRKKYTDTEKENQRTREEKAENGEDKSKKIIVLV